MSHPEDVSHEPDRTPLKPPSAPRGGSKPSPPAAGPQGTVPEADRATYETANQNPSPVPDEPLPPQD
ncbi:hypothetical protein ABZ570_19480 [Micromonospora sp. NPDC007271]|uniref:hypothetical protein n=1 Tax=Micromonospora sp. NPDC007271 TaxID=3154587 RepID=UPI0033FB3610